MPRDKKAKRQIQAFNFFYFLYNPIVSLYTRFHYRKVAIRGRDNLPKDGNYIIAPCHQNALMEPLAILYMMRTRPVVYLARADIFQNPVARFFLTFLKIMPVYRIRDGKSNLSKNNEIFDRCRDVLLSGTPLCLMAEGRHNDRHQLLPLVKGMFRIATEAQRAMGDKPLYIVPTGVDFDEYERPYANLVVNIGTPIPVQQFMALMDENEPVGLNRMRDALTAGLLDVMHDIRSKTYYDQFYTLSNVLNKAVRKEHRLSNDAWGCFCARQIISRWLDNMEASEGIELPSVISQTDEYSAICRKYNLREKLVAERWSWGRLLLTSAVVLAAVALLCSCGEAGTHARWFALMWFLCQPLVYFPLHLIPRRIIKDPQFRSSVNYGIHALLGQPLSVVLAIVVGFVMGWWYALAFYAMSFVCARCAAPLLGTLRDLCENWHYRLLCLRHGKELQHLDKLQYDLAKKYTRPRRLKLMADMLK